MDRLVVQGGARLKGTVRVNGAKNSVLPIMAATLLAEGPSVIEGAPDVRDVRTLLQVLQVLGVKGERAKNGTLRLEVVDETPVLAPYRLVCQMRASICVLGPLLARRHKVRVSLPGGCVIGVRPIDLHRKGIEALGARTRIQRGYVVAEGARLHGASVFLGGPFGSTVLGTDNTMMTATLARGLTTIEGAACEPEVVDLAEFLNKMGAAIEGAGSPVIRIRGVRRLHGARHKVIPDRIEAATFMIAAAMTRGDVTVENVRTEHLGAVIDILRKAGVKVTAYDSACRVVGPKVLKPVDVTTLPYPGVPTDVQAQLMALLCLANGISVVTEKIYPDRFMHVAELQRMGADLRKEGPAVIVNGGRRLSGAEVMASDLRAGACLVLAGLVAKGETKVRRIYHLDRGYERIEERLQALGAEIYRDDDGEEAPNKPKGAAGGGDV
ncbi:MAG TPA: UDP-N-acetylglucosamine 1-carboxyvinyltransferase [Planctomycetota bacterium]|nr:UDP-N-acetylglucosamine 1-carboxyvinyltransferase [Planctomycetota bacterium]HRR79832.1 UDP-N-acetylglucosamine 1-carboxyvinyltransferase [Planctomycetota bacterium]HRT92908.1 UDP-N-acetylglucosamine 1-carboxyvinyltransferase [Planctomycetota bacterium]